MRSQSHANAARAFRARQQLTKDGWQNFPVALEARLGFGSFYHQETCSIHDMARTICSLVDSDLATPLARQVLVRMLDKMKQTSDTFSESAAI